MDYAYRLENVDPRITEALKKAKEEQRERERKAWEAEGNKTQQEALCISSGAKLIPGDLDQRVAKLKLESMGIKIDRLTLEQEGYLAGWSEGA